MIVLDRTHPGHPIRLTLLALGALWLTAPSRAWPVGDSTPMILDEGHLGDRLWCLLRRRPSGRLQWVRLDAHIASGPLLRTPDAILVTRAGDSLPDELLELSARGQIRRRRRLPETPVGPPRIDPMGRIVLLFRNEIRWYDSRTLKRIRRPQVRVRRIQATTPALAPDGSVYVSLYSGYLSRVDAKARWQWRTSLPGTLPGPPLLHHGLAWVCSGTGQTLVTVNPLGRVQWSRPIGRCHHRPIPLPGGDVLVASVQGIFRYSSKGTQRWKLATRSPIVSLVAGADGLFFAASRNGDVFAFTADGSRRWILRTGSQGPITLAPLPTGGVAVASAAGHLLALDSAGHLQWHARLPKRPHRLAVRWDGMVVVLTPRNGLRLIAPPPRARRPAAGPSPHPTPRNPNRRSGTAPNAPEPQARSVP